ncbi:ribokinase [Aliiroseovarius sp. Z3]|uniref:ribokinase n=1 Tax=Aliiroseovarius sp. Z3 TaxID=2811402 RepID=UPI0023B3241D|nr:ribokinase [Aliiroseovarius sp. Z3]MDE9450143.1 ribokinase [Aliiroseovarius sp. Z3]
MAIYNLGSINMDHFYEVDHLPVSGETLASLSYRVGLGGKGANQSIAAALSGAQVRHIGAIGAEGEWCKARLSDAGVDTDHVVILSTATGHANICVDTAGENLIILYSGANAQISEAQIDKALREAGSDDYLVLQNETGLTFEAAQMARARGAFVVYSAAPFDATRAIQMLPVVDLLVVNEVEAQQLSKALGTAIEDIDVPNLLITRGSNGAEWRVGATGERISVDAFTVDPVDTTGAGDCFIGNTVAALDQGMTIADAMRFGAAASAIQVTRHGTADAMPSRAEVEAFLAEKGSD